MNRNTNGLKKQLRQKILAQLQQLSHETTRELSTRIADHLTESRFWKNAACIFCFLSMPGEVQTEPIILRALKEGKMVGVPRMYKDEITFHRIETMEGPWDIHEFGIKEPLSTLPKIEPPFCKKTDLLTITPGLAFDTSGGRLGRGGGFYDKFFSKFSDSLLIFGVCFSFQLVEEVPTEHHDCLIHGVITEQGIHPSICCPPEIIGNQQK
jgi:5-formyltetrahydrofolate cyclo-ligase